VTRGHIPFSAPSDAIDAAVSEHGGSLYELDGDRLAELGPDLILTQEQCDVCAVNEATVRRVAAKLPGDPLVESVNPTTLAEIVAMFFRVGDLLGAHDAAETLVAQFAATAAEIGRRRWRRPTRKVLVLEWFDPPFSSGHWNPALIDLAGGVEMIGEAGQRSRRISWDDVAEADPDLILLAPCRFTLDRSEAELGCLEARPEWSRLRAVRDGEVVLVDGSAYFSRPGPRLEASLRIAAAAIDPDACGELAPAEGWRRLAVVG
jgi:iron complex transport system substrate-binding protein